MNTIKFKTTINCGGCVAKVTPLLNKTVGEHNWGVDIDSPDKILTIETNTISSDAIQEAVKSLGFQITHLK